MKALLIFTKNAQKKSSYMNIKTIASLLLLFGFSRFCFPQSDTLTILFTADMPIIGQNESGSYAQLATAVKQYRAAQADTLFLFGGNSLGPSPMSSFDSGSHIVDLLNSIEPDVMGVTKREYSYFEEQLSLRSFEAVFPMVASNIFDPLQNSMQSGLLKSVTIERAGIKIGIMAVVDPLAKQQYLLNRVVVEDISKSVIQEAEILRGDGAELIIVMHGSLFPELDDLLESKVIDITLSKDHFAPEPEIEKSKNIANKILITEAGDFALLQISKQSDESIDIQWQRQTLSRFALDPDIASLELDYVQRLDRLMNLPIATVKKGFNTYRNATRSSENEFANMITDAVLDYTDADIAIINSGGIRGDTAYAPSHVFTRKNLVSELPFRAGIVTVQILGQDLLKTLELSVSEFEYNKGRFPQLSGAEMIFDSSRPANSRLLSVKIQGDELQADKLYTLATTDYLYNGGDGYTEFANAQLIENSQSERIILSDLVLYSILQTKVISVEKQNRIVNAAELKGAEQ
jgi:2',3'-cyclic-nucleotide 2'-phosphodiesterase (5'-nucleotidase family)